MTRSVSLGGINITELDEQDLVRSIIAMCEVDGQHTIGYLNAHVFNQCWKFPEVYNALLQADLVYADGASIGWAAKITGQEPIKRATSADWLDQSLLQLADAGLRIYCLGGDPGVSEEFVRNLRGKTSDAQVFAGASDGYFKNQSVDDTIRLINASDIDILVVGMGTPWQEKFVQKYRQDLRCRVIWWIGAGMDYYVGEQTRGPAWTRKIGHEWLGRLMSDPRRLARRYLIGNPQFLMRAALRKSPKTQTTRHKLTS